MSSDNMHRVRVHFWRDQQLQFLDSFFLTLEDAVSFANHHSHRDSTAGVKVYDPDGQMVHNKNNTPYDPGIYA